MMSVVLTSAFVTISDKQIIIFCVIVRARSSSYFDMTGRGKGAKGKGKGL